MNRDDLDRHMMTLALREAGEAADMGEVPVGAIIADSDSGEIVSQAHNRPIADCDPTAHAEIRALRQAADRLGNYRLTGLGLWVTLEPCSMCAGAILHARIGRLVFAASDAKGGAIIHGAKVFDSAPAPPQWVSGLMAADSATLLRNFFSARR